MHWNGTYSYLNSLEGDALSTLLLNFTSEQSRRTGTDDTNFLGEHINSIQKYSIIS